jgi:chemotaxis protein methyltransferase CheR
MSARLARLGDYATFLENSRVMALAETAGRKAHVPTPSRIAPFDDMQGGITLAHAIVDTIHNPLLVLDQDLRVVAASRAFYQTFQVIRENVVGQPVFEIDGGQWNAPELRAVLDALLKDHKPIDGHEIKHVSSATGQRVMLLNARRVFYEKAARNSILLVFEDITDRREAEKRVQDLLREKDMLMDEMQHRVANSLQIIASILLIKAHTVQSEETRLQLHDAHQRIMSVAAVQQHLHSSGRNDPIEVAGYLSKLCRTLADSMIGDSRTISVRVVADAGTAVSHKAVSIGLIVTELVINALKHAFPVEKPDAEITVSYRVAGTDWRLTIADNGIGKPDSTFARGKPGLGTSLVDSLAKQLDASVDTASDVHGTAVSVTHATFKPLQEPGMVH